MSAVFAFSAQMNPGSQQASDFKVRPWREECLSLKPKNSTSALLQTIQFCWLHQRSVSLKL